MSESSVSNKQQGQSGLIQAALLGLCPHCGARSLFEAPAQIAGQCGSCKEPLAELERGGRLAGLLTILVAALLIVCALAFDEWVRPPIWLHAVLWVPLTIGAVLGALRVFKTASVYREFEKRRVAGAQRKPR
ncbi:MAG: DUF983 domain-containing protein [Pseudomonadota bacterium]